jgi:hypothetical protein
LTVAGWQGYWRWSRDGGDLQRLRPVLYKIWPDQTQTFLLEGLPRYWGWESNEFRLAAVPKLPPDILTTLTTDFSSPPNNILTDDVAEGMLLAAMRSLAQLPERGVGNDYLSVSVYLPRTPMVKIRYHPESSAPGFYTGWLVTPSVIQPPQAIQVSQGMSTGMQSGPLSISFEGPPSGPGFRASSTDQPRRPPPRRASRWVPGDAAAARGHPQAPPGAPLIVHRSPSRPSTFHPGRIKKMGARGRPVSRDAGTVSLAVAARLLPGRAI